MSRVVGAVKPASFSRRFSARPVVLDVNQVLLLGAARDAKLVRGVVEVTLAGQVTMPGGKVLPWYHKVQMEGSIPRAGEVLRVTGFLEHVKFFREGEARSIVRVQAESVTPSGASGFEVGFLPGEAGGSSILLGGENRVRLSGNLTQGAESSVMPSGDSMTRLNLAVEGPGGRRGYFLLKAWREQSRLVSSLGAGARVGVNGALLSERFEHRGLTSRNQVVVEVTGSNTSGKRVG